MRAIARVGMMVAALCVVHAAAKDQYVLREDHPETGSSIARATLMWPVPIEARYQDLTADQQRLVRGDYVSLGANDEPAYPAYGMAPILREVAKLSAAHPLTNGIVHLAVRVDASGQPRAVAVLKSPDPTVSKAFSYHLMRTTYKPATCAGRPCDSDYSFRYNFAHQHPRNFIVDWNPVMWVKMRKAH